MCFRILNTFLLNGESTLVRETDNILAKLILVVERMYTYEATPTFRI